MQDFIYPMLASNTSKAFDNKDWIFEIKWDGYRTITVIKDDKINIYSRNKENYNKKFESIYNSLSLFKENIILDGEIVYVNDKGVSNFSSLQTYLKTKIKLDKHLIYYVFDILYYKNLILTQTPLIKRKEILKRILPNNKNLRYCDHITEKGKPFFNLAIKNGAEGIIAKKINSLYYPGKRSKDWLKIKSFKTQDAVILGFIRSRKELFKSLILGAYQNKKLNYIGNVGSGFNTKNQKIIIDKLKAILANKPAININIPNSQWVKPEITCTVKYSELTQDNHLRHPVFLHLRDDLPSQDARLQEKIVPENINSTIQDIKITNSQKIFFPKHNYTKKDVIDYYSKISDIILPYLIDRPQNLNRFPNGIHKKSFYQKNMSKIPSWAKTAPIYSKEEEKTINYLLCQNKKTLLYMANLASIEINPWSSRVQNLDYPDFLIIDLDPVKIGFDQVIQTAQVINKILLKLSIPSYPKTSGMTGLHILIPTRAKYTYTQIRNLAKIISILANKTLPKTTSIEPSISKRTGKVYIDFGQNAKGKTICAPYSLRPHPDATISTPLQWDEVNQSLRPENFTIKNIFDRLKDKNDILKPLTTQSIDLKSILEKLNNLNI